MELQKRGLLTVLNVRLPFETVEKQAEADKINEQIKGCGFQTVRLAYDWGVQESKDLLVNHPRVKDARGWSDRTHQPLKQGDLVRVFKTVSEGAVCFDGVVNYSTRKYHHGLQKGMRSHKWTGMFYEGLPAKLERKGVTTYGALEAFAETGTEGPIWSMSAYGKTGYDALICLQNGDKLTVYSDVRDGDAEWEGALDFNVPEGPVKINDYTEVMRTTNHIETDKWLAWSWQRRPVIVRSL